LVVGWYFRGEYKGIYLPNEHFSLLKLGSHQSGSFSVLTGSEEEALLLCQACRALCTKGSFQLIKWIMQETVGLG